MIIGFLAPSYQFPYDWWQIHTDGHLRALRQIVATAERGWVAHHQYKVALSQTDRCQQAMYTCHGHYMGMEGKGFGQVGGTKVGRGTDCFVAS